MNKQLTTSGLILASLIFGSLLLFTWMLLTQKPAQEARPDGTSIVEQRRAFDPYNVPAQ